jgi:hypothetical protein
MSSRDQDDADKQLQQAVPWVSDPNNQEQRDEQTRRLQEDVIEAAKRLERGSGLLPAQQPADARTAVGFRLSAPRARRDEASPEDRAQQIWAELKPQFILRQEKSGLSVLTIAAGLLGAMAVSAIVALAVVNVVHYSTVYSNVRADLPGEERAAKGDSRAAATLGELARFSEAQAKMTHIDEPVVPPETLLGSVPPNDIAAPKTPAAATPLSAKVEPARPEIVTPAASPVPTVNAVPESRPASPQPQTASPLPQDEVAPLLKRGQDLLAAGDIASARLMLTLVAEAGNAEACVILAGTFDPAVLAKLRAVGVQGDPEKARAWYARAAELGSQEARQRLQALR